MPIYAYRCASCGFENDHLQKLSDAALSVCPQCAQATYRKQVTAAGFQLKGSGWYATDFKHGHSKAPAAKAPADQQAPVDKESAAPDKPASSTESAPASACATGAGACADH
jgi:putative FmdB family regulatory protein